MQENVEFFFSLFPSLSPSQELLLLPGSSGCPLPPPCLVPRPCTLQHLVTNYFDLQAIPR